MENTYEENSEVTKINSEEAYWSGRYENQSTGWDIGFPSLPLKTYIDQLEDKNLSILIPGAGNAYEAEYFFKEGFPYVHVIDISPAPLKNLKRRVANFPEGHLINTDFFEHSGSYDLILEQTFFCSFEPLPETRMAYAEKMNNLLKPNGKLVGVWFKHPIHENSKRPFGGSKEEYLRYLLPNFKVKTFEDCHNSIPERMGNELFGIFEKKASD